MASEPTGLSIDGNQPPARLFAAIFETMTDGVAGFGMDGQILFCNPAMSVLTGRPLADLVGRTPLDVWGSTAPFGVEAATQTPWEERVNRPDGAYRVLSVRAFHAIGEPPVQVAVFRDVTRLRQADHALRVVVEGISAATGDAFFRSLVQNLAEVLEVRCAFIGELAGPAHDRIRTLAVWDAKRIVSNYEYRLEGTMCATVVGREMRCYSRNIQDLFPADPRLARDHYQSYLGVPLFDSAGNPQGVLAVLHSRPLTVAPMAESIMGIFALRAGSELDRNHSEMHRAAFSTLGEKLSAAETPEQAARIIVGVADELLGWDACLLDIYDRESLRRVRTVLRIDTIEGRRCDVTSRHPDDGIRSEVILRTIRSGPQLVLRGAEDVAVAMELTERFGDMARLSASLMFVPIRCTGSMVGVLSIQSYTPQAYSRRNLVTLAALAEHCSGALGRLAAGERVVEVEERLRTLINSMPDAVTFKDGEGRWLVCNDFARGLFRLEDVDYQGKTNEELGEISDVRRETTDTCHATDEAAWQAEALSRSEQSVRGTDGERHTFDVIKVPLFHPDGSRKGLVVVGRDITQRKEVEAQLVHQAFHDQLTGLPNRALFQDRLSHTMARASGRGESFAVLFLDLDRFKVINDSLGHTVGDQLLVAFGQRLQHCVRPGDTVARLGGDEFAILLDDVAGMEEVTRIADRIQESLREPFDLGSNEVFTAASIGIAMSVGTVRHSDDLLRDADVAMYRAKAHGRGRYEVFDATMHARALELMQMENDLRRAVLNGEFFLDYQPKVALKTGCMVGMEALLRWNHPRRGIIMPERFVPLSEEMGLILNIGEWVLWESCRQAREWILRGVCRPGFVVSVNISACQLQQSNLLESISAALEESGLGPRNLSLEITESAVMERAEDTVGKLARLKQLGVGLEIDDFGTGYSSLSYLAHFPVDSLKISRMFTSRLGADEENTEIVQAIIALAHNLKLQVTAEGVETADQVASLRKLNCEFAQGNFFALPVDGNAAGELLATEMTW